MGLRDLWIRLRHHEFGRPPKVGDRVRIHGGYEMDPDWLRGAPDGYRGTIAEFIPGQNTIPALVVELDTAITDLEIRGERVSGRFLVLEQAWEGVRWGQTSPRLHVELCDFRPEAKAWQDRRQGFWAESHATFNVLEPSDDATSPDAR